MTSPAGWFDGLPVREFNPDGVDAVITGEVAWCFRDEYGDYEFAPTLTAFLDRGGSATRVLIIDRWREPWSEDDETPSPPDVIVSVAERLPHLRALCIGALESDHIDVGGLLSAYPGLRLLHLPGGNLRLRPLRHESLRELAIGRGGLPGEFARALGACELPALQTLDLWLDAGFTDDVAAEDLRGILAGSGLPALRALSLCDAGVDIPPAVASAPLVARLTELDLSSGGLSERGVAQLLDGQPLTHLRRLDLSDHDTLGDSVEQRLRAALPGVDVELPRSRRQGLRAWVGAAAEFADAPIVQFDPANMAAMASVVGTAPDRFAWRLHTGHSRHAAMPFEAMFTALLDSVGDAVRVLVIGDWRAGRSFDAPAPIQAIADAARRLPHLRALYLGDITSEVNEISWIRQGDITPLLGAFPRLEMLKVRGGGGLRLQRVRHEALRSLVLESGGLPAHVVRGVGECELPALEHLELWLGEEHWGGDATVADLAGILSGERLPALRSLALRDAEYADLIAVALASAPIVDRLTELDLSLGVLTDLGAEALLSGQPLTHLRRLDLSHHFITKPGQRRLRAALPGVALDVSEQQDPHDPDERYVAVGE